MITAMNLVKQVLKVLLLGSALWALWNGLHVHQRNINAASVKRAIRHQMRHKYLLAFAAAVYLAAYSLCSYVHGSNQATEVIKLNYEEASKGRTRTRHGLTLRRSFRTRFCRRSSGAAHTM